MARVGLKGAWLEAARLSRHRAHSLLSRVFVATKERTCVCSVTFLLLPQTIIPQTTNELNE